MAKTTTLGQCLYCKKTLGKTAMKNHFGKCEKPLENEISLSKSPLRQIYFTILVEGYYLKDYWMYVEVSSKTTLKELDEFLRNEWLECCGHLSSFYIQDINYDSSSSREFGGRGMSKKLEAVIFEGIEFRHEYDYGSSTHLKLKVVKSEERIKAKEKIRLLAKNLPLVIKCKECGEDATQLCAECIYEEEAFFCDECAEKHECGEDMMLPVVNSPRMGVCGYCG